MMICVILHRYDMMWRRGSRGLVEVEDLENCMFIHVINMLMNEIKEIYAI